MLVDRDVDMSVQWIAADMHAFALGLVCLPPRERDIRVDFVVCVHVRESDED